MSVDGNKVSVNACPELEVLASDLSSNADFRDIERRLERLVVLFDGPHPTTGCDAPSESEPSGFLPRLTLALSNRNEITNQLHRHLNRLEQIIG